MIERADFERTWVEVASSFARKSDAAGDWLEGNEINSDDFLEFLDSHLLKMVLSAVMLIEKEGAEEAHAAMLSVAAAMFFMGWEMHEQLGKGSTHVAE